MFDFSVFSLYLGVQWWWILLCLALTFFIAGFVDSIAGGGGFISTPSLLLAGIPPHLALGTNKSIVIFGTAIASAIFIAHKKILWQIVLIGAVCASFGAYIGSIAVVFTSIGTLKSVILFLLPFGALCVFLPHKLESNCKQHFTPRDIYLFTPLLTLAIGFYDGYFGPGTGSFLVLGFSLVLRMDLLYASGNAKLINLASGIGSVIAFMLHDSVLYLLALSLIVCNMLGGYCGSKLAVRKGARFVRVFVIVAFVLMFLSLLVQYRADLYATIHAIFRFFTTL